MAAALSALFAVIGNIFTNMTKICQRIQSVFYFKDDISAFSSVTAVRTAGCYEKLPAEASNDSKLYNVKKLHTGVWSF